MVDTIIEILIILKHYFKLKIKASDAARKIGKVDENETLSDYLDMNWF